MRDLGKLARCVQSRLRQCICLNNLVDQPCSQSRFCINGSPAHHQATRHVRIQHLLRDPERPSREIHAHPHLGQTEFCVRHGNAVVRGQHEEQSTRNRGSVDRANHRFGTFKKRHEAVVQRVHNRALPVQIKVLRLFQVQPCGKHLAPRRQYDHAHIIIRRQVIHNIMKPHQRRGFQRIDRRVVQNQFNDTLTAICSCNPCVIRHRFSPPIWCQCDGYYSTVKVQMQGMTLR